MDNENKLKTREYNPHDVASVINLEISSDKMFRYMRDDMEAQDCIRLDGTTKNNMRPKRNTIALRTGQFIPYSEQQLLATGALPLTQRQAQRLQDNIKYKESLKRMREQIATPTKTLRETVGTRVRLAYRLCRYMAHIRGDIYHGQKLCDKFLITKTNIRKWDVPLPDAYGKMVLITNASHIINMLMEQTNDESIRYTYLMADGNPSTTKGFSYLPPPLHDGYYPTKDNYTRGKLRMEGYVPDGYDPEEDTPLLRYCQTYALLAEYLDAMTAEEEYVMSALINPGIARQAWPTADMLEQYEECILLPLIEEMLSKKATITVERWLQENLGLTYFEAADYTEAGKTHASCVHTYTPSQERTTVLNSLDLLREDCSENGMLTTQLNTLKTQINVLALTPREDESKLQEGEELASELEMFHNERRHRIATKEDAESDNLDDLEI